MARHTFKNETCLADRSSGISIHQLEELCPQAATNLSYRDSIEDVLLEHVDHDAEAGGESGGDTVFGNLSNKNLGIVNSNHQPSSIRPRRNSVTIDAPRATSTIRFASLKTKDGRAYSLLDRFLQRLTNQSRLF
jgi:hypothetical protein